jgi:uncharacterized protein
MNYPTTFRTVHKIFLTGLLVLAALLAQSQKEIPAPPNPPRLVNDFAGMLSSGEVQQLENKLVAYNDSTSTQIAIVIEKSTEGEDIFDYSYRIAESWGVGGGENDNGVLIYVAQNDRNVRIQTGYGVEHFLPDVMAKRIIENIIVPYFKRGDYYGGLDRATDVMIQLGNGEYEGTGPGKKEFPVGLIILLIIFFVIIFIIIAKNSDSGGGYGGGGRYERDRGGWIILGPGGGGGWNSGGGGGGFGGGGFGGFGGGSFGGGGAGGSW